MAKRKAEEEKGEDESDYLANIVSETLSIPYLISIQLIEAARAGGCEIMSSRRALGHSVLLGLLRLV